MRILITTDVEAGFEHVRQNFDQRLLEKVSPPFPPTRLLRYDGNQPGGEVHVELNFIFFRQVWKSQIKSYLADGRQMVFTDEGTQLPFFLAYWHHRHGVEARGSGSRITDDITFRTPTRLTDYLLYPLMYVQFAYRKPMYRKYFKKPDPNGLP